MTMASSGKKPRRSSLAAAKIREDDIYPSPSGGLYRQVKMSLSPEERLQELSRLCLKASIETVCQDSGSLDVKDRLDSVKDDLYKMFDTEEYKNIVKNIGCQPEQLLPNPANIELDKTKEELERRIERLRKEEEDWSEYLSDIDRQVQEAETKYGNLKLSQTELTEEQINLSKQYLPEFIDLDGIKQQAQTALNMCYILLGEHEKQIDLQTERQRKADKKLDELRIQLQEKTFPGMDSPDAILQRLIDLPSTEEEPST